MNEKIKRKLEEVAETKEKSYEEVKIVFSALKEMIKEDFSYLSKSEVDIHAANAISSYFDEDDGFEEGKPFTFVCMGVASNARDVNKDLREEILEEWSDRENQIPMMRQGKVMVIKISDKDPNDPNVNFEDVFQPVTEIDKTTPGENGEVIVTEGTLWKNTGDKPIARDYRKYIEYGDEMYENGSWSKPLYPKWKIKLFGIGYFNGSKGDQKKTITNSGKKTIMSISGERANIKSPKFILKKPIMFSPVRVRAVETDKSDELSMNVWIRRDDTFDYSGKNIKIEPIVKELNKRIYKEAIEIKKKWENPDKYPENKKELTKLRKKYHDYENPKFKYIPFIDLSEIDKYHKVYRAIKEDGKILKNDSGWDITKFVEWALCSCTYLGVYENEERGNKYILDDYSLSDDDKAWMKYANGLPTNIQSKSAVVISIQTSRGNLTYDEDIEDWVEDAEAAEAFGRVKGIKMMLDLKKAKQDKLKERIRELKGDL